MLVVDGSKRDFYRLVERWVFYCVFFLVFPLKIYLILTSAANIPFPININFVLYAYAFVLILAGVLRKILTKNLLTLKFAGVDVAFYFGMTILPAILVVSMFGKMSYEESTFYWGAILSSISYYILGTHAYSRINSRVFISICFVVCAVPIIALADFTTLTIKFKALFRETKVNYLLIGDIIAIIGFIMMSKLQPNSKVISWTLMLAFVLILFFCGSRTSFYIAFGLFGLLVLVDIWREPVVSIPIFTGSTLFLAVSSLAFFDLSSIDSARMFGFLLGEEDSSLHHRQLILNYGIAGISDNWWLGDFMGQVKNPLGLSPLGSYIHNFLSYWRQFGLISFIGISLILVNVFSNSLKLITEGNDSSKYLGCLLLYTVLALVLSRSFVHTIYFFIFGYFYSYKKLENVI